MLLFTLICRVAPAAPFGNIFCKPLVIWSLRRSIGGRNLEEKSPARYPSAAGSRAVHRLQQLVIVIISLVSRIRHCSSLSMTSAASSECQTSVSSLPLVAFQPIKNYSTVFETGRCRVQIELDFPIITDDDHGRDWRECVANHSTRQSLDIRVSNGAKSNRRLFIHKLTDEINDVKFEVSAKNPKRLTAVIHQVVPYKWKSLSAQEGQIMRERRDKNAFMSDLSKNLMKSMPGSIDAETLQQALDERDKE